MRILLIALLFSVNCFGQKEKPGLRIIDNNHTAQMEFGYQKQDTVITDSTPLLTIKQIDRVAKYLEDKMIAKDYNLVMAALNSVLQEAIIERKKKKP